MLLHHARAPGNLYHKPPLFRTAFEQAPKQHGDSRVGEHEGAALGLAPVDIGLGKHKMQQAADSGYAIMDGYRDTGTERIGGQHMIPVVAHLAIRHSHHD